jgi:hypothetical protein
MSLSRRNRFPVVIAAALAAAGCAGETPGVNALRPGTPYTLTEEEKKLDCARLTGRIQVRLFALRGAEQKVGASEAAGTMRTVTSAAFGTQTAKNAAERVASNRPVLEAYNKRLVELGCASFDIEAELAARTSAPPPVPTVPAPKKNKS